MPQYKYRAVIVFLWKIIHVQCNWDSQPVLPLYTPLLKIWYGSDTLVVDEEFGGERRAWDMAHLQKHGACQESERNRRPLHAA